MTETRRRACISIGRDTVANAYHAAYESDHSLENDQYGGIGVGEICTGPGDYQFIVTRGHTRFILVIKRPEVEEKDCLLTKWFDKLETTEDDPDDMVHLRCMEDIQDSVISACRETIYALSAPYTALKQEQTPLHDFLYPATFCLQLLAQAGKLGVVHLKDDDVYTSMHVPACVKLPSSHPSIKHLVAADQINFVKDIFMGQVLKVSHNGRLYIFKSAHEGDTEQLAREIQTLQQIEDSWASDHVERPRVPRIHGVVTSECQIVGLLEEYIDGENLYEIEVDQIPTSQRRKWKQEIEKSIKLLHQRNLVWGDAKANNVLIDRDSHTWLIDFGGSFTDGWVDEHLAETMEGDLQGFSRIIKFLQLRQ